MMQEEGGPLFIFPDREKLIVLRISISASFSGLGVP
jgi:hypothetical protein